MIRPNPLKADPSRTATLRRRAMAEVNKRINKLKGMILRLIEVEDAFGLKRKNNKLSLNTRWAFQTSDQQLASFRQWLQANVDDTLLDSALTPGDAWLQQYIDQSYAKGAGRAFDETRKKFAQNNPDFFQGQKSQFLNEAFGAPASIERVRLLAARTFDDLKGINAAMSQRMGQILTDGLIQGMSPRDIARAINNSIDKIGKNRALTVARTEIIRAHAEGQLDGLEKLGVTEVGVAVEWSTTGDDRVCPLCLPLEGVVMSIKEARGTLPRHPNCRCAWIPANVGEPTTGQLRSSSKIKGAIGKSIRAEAPKRPLPQQRERSRWLGADTVIRRARPKSIFADAPKTAKTAQGTTPSVKLPPPKSALQVDDLMRGMETFDEGGVELVRSSDVFGRVAEGDELTQARSAFVSAKKSEHVTVIVDKKDLVPTQEGISKDHLSKLVQKERSDKLPTGVFKDGKLYLDDGHHRAAAELLKGAKQLEVRVPKR